MLRPALHGRLPVQPVRSCKLDLTSGTRDELGSNEPSSEVAVAMCVTSGSLLPFPKSSIGRCMSPLKADPSVSVTPGRLLFTGRVWSMLPGQGTMDCIPASRDESDRTYAEDSIVPRSRRPARARYRRGLRRHWRDSAIRERNDHRSRVDHGHSG